MLSIFKEELQKNDRKNETKGYIAIIPDHDPKNENNQGRLWRYPEIYECIEHLETSVSPECEPRLEEFVKMLSHSTMITILRLSNPIFHKMIIWSHAFNNTIIDLFRTYQQNKSIEVIPERPPVESEPATNIIQNPLITSVLNGDDENELDEVYIGDEPTVGINHTKKSDNASYQEYFKTPNVLFKNLTIQQYIDNIANGYGGYGFRCKPMTKEDENRFFSIATTLFHFRKRMAESFSQNEYAKRNIKEINEYIGKIKKCAGFSIRKKIEEMEKTPSNIDRFKDFKTLFTRGGVCKNETQIKSSNIYMKSLRKYKSKQNKTRKSKNQRGGIGIPSGLLKAASGFASKAASSGLANKALSAAPGLANKALDVAQKTPYGSLAANALGKAQQSGLLDKGLDAFHQSGIMDKLQSAVPMQSAAPVESPEAVVKEFAEASDFQKEKAQAAEAEEAKFKAEEDKFKAEKEKIEAQITLANLQKQQGGSKRYRKQSKGRTQKSKK